MTEQEVFINHPEGGGEVAYGSQSAHLRMDVTQELLNLSVPPREFCQKMSSLSATAAAGCERHQFEPKLKSLSPFYLLWVSFKSVILSSPHGEDLLM